MQRMPVESTVTGDSLIRYDRGYLKTRTYFIYLPGILSPYPKTPEYFNNQRMKPIRILLLGSGGREHAIAWKISQSPDCEKLFIAPGNAGTATCGENVDIATIDFLAIQSFCLREHIEHGHRRA